MIIVERYREKLTRNIVEVKISTRDLVKAEEILSFIRLSFPEDETTRWEVQEN